MATFHPLLPLLLLLGGLAQASAQDAKKPAPAPFVIPPDVNGMKSIIPAPLQTREITVGIYCGPGSPRSGVDNVLNVLKPFPKVKAVVLSGAEVGSLNISTYDVLVFPKHLAAVKELVQKNPDQSFVIDHLAKPYIKAGEIEAWAKDMRELAQYPNLYCKISGMVTEADYKKWKPENFTPYLDVVVNAFGTQRIMYGSDWPVCLVAASYAQVLSIVKNYFSSFTPDEQAAFFAGNATRFYHL